jgi:hypothetical protein
VGEYIAGSSVTPGSKVATKPKGTNISDAEHDDRAVGGIAGGASESAPTASPLFRAYAAFTKLAPKFGIPVAAMDAPPVAKTDLRPWRSQIEALLVGIAMSPVVRRALLDAFEEHGLLAYTEPEPEIAVDELGRLRKTRVNKVLEDFDENVRSRVVSVLEELHAIA